MSLADITQRMRAGESVNKTTKAEMGIQIFF